MDTQLGIVLRPKTFDDVVEQQDVVNAMKGWVDKGMIPRAVLLVGPAGTGKTTLGGIFARAVQGPFYPADGPIDLVEVNAASMRGIDAARELVDMTETHAMYGDYRVIILDEAQQLTKEAQNVLLKPFEDPDSRTIWIICTTDPHKIIPALVTRCQKFELKRMTAVGIETLVKRAAEHCGVADYQTFLAIAIREKLNQPRPLLNAFGNFANSVPAEEAISAQLQNNAFEAFEIAKGVVYGDWNKDTNVWGKPSPSVRKQLLTMEDLFKKKKKAAQAADADEEDEESGDAKEIEVPGRQEFSRTVRAITASLLKGVILSDKSTAEKRMKAIKALSLFQNALSPNPFDAALEYPQTVGVLLRINYTLRGEAY